MISSALPLLFLDVDGPLIPFGATREQLPHGYPTYEAAPHVPRAVGANPLIPRINPAHGPRLMSLPCELVWATTCDEITDADQVWVEAHHTGQALLRRVDAARGITDEDFTVLENWLRRHTR